MNALYKIKVDSLFSFLSLWLFIVVMIKAPMVYRYFGLEFPIWYRLLIVLGLTLNGLVLFCYGTVKVFRCKFEKIADLFPVLLIYVLLVYIGIIIFMNGAIVSSEVNELNQTVFFQYIIFFSLGLYVNKILKFRKILIVLYWLVALFWLANVNEFFLLDLTQSGMKDDSYLMYSDYFAVLALIIAFMKKKSNWLIAYVLLSVVVIYTLNSRSAFVFLTFVLLFFLLLVNNKFYKYFLFFLLAGIVYLAYLYIDLDMLQHMRMFSIFFGVDADVDGSAQARQFLMEANLKDIKDNWLVGNYGGQYEMFGLAGAYIHNILSFWRQFGLFPFLGILSLLGILGYRSFRIIIDRREDEYLLVLFTIYVALGLILSKSYTYPTFWFLLGFYIYKQMQEKAILKCGF
mgnify:FL=1